MTRYGPLTRALSRGTVATMVGVGTLAVALVGAVAVPLYLWNRYGRGKPARLLHPASPVPRRSDVDSVLRGRRDAEGADPMGWHDDEQRSAA